MFVGSNIRIFYAGESIVVMRKRTLFLLLVSAVVILLTVLVMLSKHMIMPWDRSLFDGCVYHYHYPEKGLFFQGVWRDGELVLYEVSAGSDRMGWSDSIVDVSKCPLRISFEKKSYDCGELTPSIMKKWGASRKEGSESANSNWIMDSASGYELKSVFDQDEIVGLGFSDGPMFPGNDTPFEFSINGSAFFKFPIEEGELRKSLGRPKKILREIRFPKPDP